MLFLFSIMLLISLEDLQTMKLVSLSPSPSLLSTLSDLLTRESHMPQIENCPLRNRLQIFWISSCPLCKKCKTYFVFTRPNLLVWRQATGFEARLIPYANLMKSFMEGHDVSLTLKSQHAMNDTTIGIWFAYIYWIGYWVYTAPWSGPVVSDLWGTNHPLERLLSSRHP